MLLLPQVVAMLLCHLSYFHQRPKLSYRCYVSSWQLPRTLGLVPAGEHDVQKISCKFQDAHFDKLQSWKSQAGTQVQISDLEFSLESHFPTTPPPPNPSTHPPPPGKSS